MAKRKIRGPGKAQTPPQVDETLSEPTGNAPPEEQGAESTSGGQLDLIDVTPEHGKAILAIAKDYKKVVVARMRMGEKEVDLKGKLLELIKKENLARLENGSIRFRLDGMIITVTPRDELIKVKEEGEEQE
jgi:hypothetical protein